MHIFTSDWCAFASKAKINVFWIFFFTPHASLRIECGFPNLHFFSDFIPLWIGMTRKEKNFFQCSIWFDLTRRKCVELEKCKYSSHLFHHQFRNFNLLIDILGPKFWNGAFIEMSYKKISKLFNLTRGLLKFDLWNQSRICVSKYVLPFNFAKKITRILFFIINSFNI